VSAGLKKHFGKLVLVDTVITVNKNYMKFQTKYRWGRVEANPFVPPAGCHVIEGNCWGDALPTALGSPKAHETAAGAQTLLATPVGTPRDRVLSSRIDEGEECREKTGKRSKTKKLFEKTGFWGFYVPGTLGLEETRSRFVQKFTEQALGMRSDFMPLCDGRRRMLKKLSAIAPEKDFQVNKAIKH